MHLTDDPAADAAHWLDTLDACPGLLPGVLRTLDEHAIVAVTDRRGRILYANRHFCRLSKYRLDELLGQDHRLLNSHRHSREFMKQMWATIGHGQTWHGQFCNRAKDGSLYWVQSTIVPILDVDGRPSHYVALRTDVSDIKRAELALAESEQRFRGMFEQSADALLLLDIDWEVFTDCNQSAADLLGYANGQALAGLSPAALSPPVQPDGRSSAVAAAEMMAIARREGSHRFDWWHCSPYREAFPVEVVLTVLRRDGATVLLTTWRDISARKRAEAWQAHYTGILDALVRDQDIAELLQRLLQFANEQAPAVHLAAYALAADGQRILAAVAPGLPESFRQRVYDCPHRHEARDCPLLSPLLAQTHADGGRCAADCGALAPPPGLHLLRLIPLLSAAGEAMGSLAVLLDRPGAASATEAAVIEQTRPLAALVIDRAQTQQQLRLNELVFRESQEAIALTDTGGRIVAANRAFSRLVDAAETAVLGQPLARFLPLHLEPGISAEIEHSLAISGHWHGECEGQRGDAGRVPLLYSATAVGVGSSLTGTRIHVLADLSDSKRQAAQIERLAYYDELTNLPNRALLSLRLAEALDVARADGTGLALLCLDLDRFKEVNDSRGHPVGDRALGEVAQRFRQRVGEVHTLARTGGDEFALVLAGATQVAAEQLAMELLQSLQPPFRAAGHSFSLGASIGIALFPDDGHSAEDLLRQADIAMYRAKHAGGGYCFYREAMGRSLIRQLDVAARLDRALAEDRLQLHYQPLVRLRDGRMVAAEALLRWQDPDEGWMGPAEFVAVAEARNKMPELGAWVFRRACRQVREWRNAGLNVPAIAINLSAQQLSETGLIRSLVAVLAEYDLPAAGFELELTESSVVVDPDAAIRVMTELAGLGFSLAIDDFGTGYSSLSYLKRFPAHKLKIDISFVRDMLVDRNDCAIVETIIAMADTLKLRTVAEGVETREQADALALLGCDCAQGWQFSRALAPDPFRAQWLQDWRGG